MIGRFRFSSRWSRLQPLLFAGLASAVALAIIWWNATATPLEARQHLIQWQFWVLEAQFVLFAVLTWWCLPSFVRTLGLSRSAVAAALIASLLAAVIVVVAVPRTNRIYFDEHIYLGIAQNLADLHKAQSCNEGTVEYGVLQCARGEYNKQPYGYPYLVSVLYRIGGTHEALAHWLNTAAAVLFVWAIFLITCGLWRDQRAAGFAALVAALIPQQLLWSGTSSSEPSAALMTAVAVMAAIHFVRARTTASLLWMVAATAFAMQWRTESLLVIVVVAVIVSVFARDALRQWPLWWGALLGLLLCTIYLQHLLAVRNEPWGASGDRMALGHVWSNLQVNGPYFLNNSRFPVVFTALALAGLAARRTRATLVALVYFMLFWGVFLFFYAGSYDYGADIRFSLMSHAPVAMLAGVGASSLHARLVDMGLDLRRTAIAIGAGLVFHFLTFMPLVRAVGEEAWAARADVEFVGRVAADLPANAMVLTQNPSLFHLRGINAAQMWLATEDPMYVSSIFPVRYAGGVFLHWNYWCNVDDHVQTTLCRTALGEKPGDAFRQYRERHYRYAFYRVEAGEPRLLLKTP